LQKTDLHAFQLSETLHQTSFFFCRNHARLVAYFEFAFSKALVEVARYCLVAFIITTPPWHRCIQVCQSTYENRRRYNKTCDSKYIAAYSGTRADVTCLVGSGSCPKCFVITGLSSSSEFSGRKKSPITCLSIKKFFFAAVCKGKLRTQPLNKQLLTFPSVPVGDYSTGIPTLVCV
jgi:hypothetical protein